MFKITERTSPKATAVSKAGFAELALLFGFLGSRGKKVFFNSESLEARTARQTLQTLFPKQSPLSFLCFPHFWVVVEEEFF